MLAFPPAPITAPIALEAANSSFTGDRFRAEIICPGPVQRGAALYSLEGDFGFSAAERHRARAEVGHEIKLINFGQSRSDPLPLSFQNFARNDTGDQAFISQDHTAGFNRPTNVRFGPDGCAYVVDYGAVRDRGSDTAYSNPADGPAGADPRHRRDLEDLRAEIALAAAGAGCFAPGRSRGGNELAFGPRLENADPRRAETGERVCVRCGEARAAYSPENSGLPTVSGKK